MEGSSFGEVPEDVRTEPDAQMMRRGDFDEVVVLPDRGSASPVRIRGPRLARPEQAASVAKQPIAPPVDR